MNLQMTKNMSDAVAIIGMAGRFPGAQTIEELWKNVINKKVAIETIDENELLERGISKYLLDNPNYVRVGSFIKNDIRCFDAQFFDMSKKDVESLDPQQRLFLECTWEAVEHAGYNIQNNNLRIGVFGGSTLNTYLINNILSNKDVSKNISDFEIEMNNKDHMVTRAAYKLNLHGPAVNVQCACSTSLMAVHLAIQSILNGECEIALAGGVALRFPYRVGYLYQEGNIHSISGHCRPFDSRADGTVFGNGAGIVVLKLYEEALRDNDTIHAVIIGSAVNNDGSRKSGYVTPSPLGQKNVILEAINIADIDPYEIGYVETHGTGTIIGDPIEFNSLTKAFQEITSKKQFCALGTVKANIGHLDVAAGVVGLINAVTISKKKIIPGLASLKKINSDIDVENSPFYFNRETRFFPETKPYTSISSFGVGGTNVHMILCQPPQCKGSKKKTTFPLIPLSAKTKKALEIKKNDLKKHLNENLSISLDDVAYTLQVGRNIFKYKECIYVKSISDIISQIETSKNSVVKEISSDKKIIFNLSIISMEHREVICKLFPVIQKKHEALLLEYKNIPELASIFSFQAEPPDQVYQNAIVRILFNAVLLDFFKEINIPIDLLILESENELLRLFDINKPQLLKKIPFEINNHSFNRNLTNLEKNIISHLCHFVFFQSNNLLFETTKNELNSRTISLRELFADFNKNEKEILLVDFSSHNPSLLETKIEPYKKINKTFFSLGRNSGPKEQIGRFLTLVFRSGININFEKMNQGVEGARIPLPTYPFQRKQYWIEPVTLKKDCRIPVLNSTGQSSSSLDHTRDKIIELIKNLAHQELKEDDFDYDFFEIGFDSLTISQLVSSVHEQFETDINFYEFLEKYPTPRKLIDKLGKEASKIDKVLCEKQDLNSIQNENKCSLQKIQETISNSALGPYRPNVRNEHLELTKHQSDFIHDLINRICKKTKHSKEKAAQSRKVFCDPRSVSGFNKIWKEAVYPLVASESSGARFIDIDGNEYIDMVMGFGVNYLGHSPSFITSAVNKQLKKGFEIGPQTPYAEEVAQRISELTKNERVTFSNTGSEAVIAALRIARTATRKNKIVIFSQSYHGVFDSVLGRESYSRQKGKSIPIAPGIPSSALEDTVVLGYGEDSSLQYIEENYQVIAGVLVEPVQSRNPKNVPILFLHKLRELTQKRNILLIFDEVITGFRCHQGGAQELFGIRADLITYGKIIGGGLPIGALAGKSLYMNHLDGGSWNFGDDSAPESQLTFFAGTFIRHPLSMAAAKAALQFLKEKGPILQFEVNHRVSKFCDSLNTMFSRYNVLIEIQSFSSFIYHKIDPSIKYSTLLFYLLREKGIFAWEGRVGHFSIAHNDNDYNQIKNAYEESIKELIQNKLISGKIP